MADVGGRGLLAAGVVAVTARFAPGPELLSLLAMAGYLRT